MSREEFIQKLGQALAGEVPQGVIQENIRFYDSYINDEVRKGAAEEDVTASMGDPRLIARTIIDSTISAEESGSTHGGSTYTGYHQETGQRSETSNGRSPQSFHTVDLSKWYWKVLSVVVAFVVISLVVTIIGGIFSLLAPFVFPCLIIWLIFSLIRGPRR